MKKIRTFIAIDISDPVRAEADEVVGRLRHSNATVNWVEAENFHITLKFLGDVPNVELADVCKVVTQAVASCQLEPFAVECRGLGAFPDVDRARTVWLGIGSGSEKIIALHDAIDDALPAIGFSRERKRHHPHITLGRVKCGGRERQPLVDLIRADIDHDAGVSSVSEVLVYSSTLEKSGPIYNIMGRAPLG